MTAWTIRIEVLDDEGDTVVFEGNGKWKGSPGEASCGWCFGNDVGFALRAIEHKIPGTLGEDTAEVIRYILLEGSPEEEDADDPR